MKVAELLTLILEESAEVTIETTRLTRGRDDASLKKIVREMADVVGCLEAGADFKLFTADDIKWAIDDFNAKVKAKGYRPRPATSNFFAELAAMASGSAPAEKGAILDSAQPVKFEFKKGG